MHGTHEQGPGGDYLSEDTRVGLSGVCCEKDSVHGGMHGRETRDRANLDGNQKALRKLQAGNSAATIEASTEIIQQVQDRALN